MNIKRIVGIIFIILNIGLFATTTTNALQDAKNAQVRNALYNEIQNKNKQSNDDPVMFNIGKIMSSAASGTNLYNLGNAVKGMNSSSLSSENDTSTNPSTWKKVKLKPWQIILAVIFMANELRELKSGGGSNGSVNNPNYEKSPIGKIKDTYDIRSKVVVNLFKVTGNITDKIGRVLSNVLAVFLLLMGTLEILINIFKGVTNPNTEDSKTILMVMKDMFPQLVVMGTLVMILANGFFWNFYTGPLFNLAMKIGGMISGQNFSIYNLPDYLTKLFNVPFAVMVSGVKMMFSVKGIVNNILPIVILFSGFVLLWLCIKAAIEIMTVLVDYLIIGCFAMVVMIFMALGFTKNIGVGAIGGVTAAIVNVIVMFALMGFAFNLIDRLDGNGSSDVSKLIGMIIGVFIVNGLIMQIKTIGQFLNAGNAAYIKGSSITTEVIDGGFNMLIGANFLRNTFSKGSSLAGGKSGGKNPLESGIESKGGRDILSAAVKNVENAGNSGNDIGKATKKMNFSDLRNITKDFVTGYGEKYSETVNEIVREKMRKKENEKEKGKNENMNTEKNSEQIRQNINRDSRNKNSEKENIKV
ncbi:hypothetical protein EII29_01340 [Leptotrichia sp. OH3620_COT-345]|uniref:hypothetical protein n=1 Tax=Leptotrichia sp. OH3620_COT-345 TaxID=2491048 RepID=UPI000F6528C2|nr:hypothetical protein [Leptotrichia sp. OH3620_COT-345]RRD40614.1 hypothetical protein EII29_01340 [Leptotrichia sp. OH3620_COT-345]